MSKQTWPKFPPGLPIPRSRTPTPTSSTEFPALKSKDISDLESLSLPNTRWSFGNHQPAFQFHNKKRNRKSVVSCGIICFYDDGSFTAGLTKEKDIKLLLVRRKDSLAYVEFIRGKYKPSDPLYIRSLIRGMTYAEHDKILKCSFHELWTDMWRTKNIAKHHAEYEKSLRRFTECHNEIHRYILSLDGKARDEPEWTFPKGRPKYDESDILCAIREFQEESGIRKERLRIFKEDPYFEVYTGTNGIVYENRYFLATTDVDSPSFDPDNPIQREEISDVKWYSPDMINIKMSETYPSRDAIIQDAIRQFLMKG